MVLLLAFSLQDQVEKYGAYVGLAAFLGLAVLALLYFAQARELKRLRDWAGRAPERALELEARVVAQAEEALRVPEPAAERSGTVGPAQPVARPEPVAAPAAGNGRQAGTPAPIPLGPRPATAVAAAAARAAAAPQPAAVATQEAPATVVEESADGAAPAEAAAAPLSTPERPEQATPPPEPQPEPAPEPEPEPEAEPEGAGNGVPAEPVIPRATPRPQPTPAPAPAAAPLRSSTTRTASPPRRRPERDGDSSRTARITVLTLVGVIVLAAAAFGASQIFGGEDPPTAPNPTVEPGATPPGESTAGAGNGQDAAAARPTTIVAILNGTPTEGLAKRLRDKLVAEGYSEQQGLIRTGNNLDQQRQDSVVLYRAGKRRQARDVAQILDIGGLEQMDDDTQALADSTDSTSSGKPSDVAVIAGADQSP